MAFRLQQEVIFQMPRNRYKKLTNENDEKAVRSRKKWVVKKTNGRIKGLRLSRAKRFTLRAFTVILVSKRISALCSEMFTRLLTDGVCPSIVFSSQWGLPVLSHISSVSCY